jgi:lipid-binding SYLF domain-containing protein
MRFVGTIVLLVSAASPALAQSPLDTSVDKATQVLREIMTVPLRCIPESLLREAEGIAIVPGMVKGGFIVGVEHGKGVLVTRDEAGVWHAPVFITVSGGSLGAQAGVQATDLVLVYKSQRSVERTLKGRVKIGADLAVAAGPVGRDASSSTDVRLKTDVLSYSRSRGLFAGLAIDGATVHVDYHANAEYYAIRPGQVGPAIPVSAVTLVHTITQYAPPPPRTGPISPPVLIAPHETPPPPALQPPEEREAIRQQLAAAAHRLQPLLEPTWQQYLALPAEVFTGHAAPSGATFEVVLHRYQTVAGDARYRTLSDHPEFQETFTLLRRFAALARPAGTLSLPPPPAH